MATYNLLVKNRKFSLPLSHLVPSFGMTPFKFLVTLKNPETLKLSQCWQWWFRNLSLHRFHTVSRCDRWTHRQMPLW